MVSPSKQLVKDWQAIRGKTDVFPWAKQILVENKTKIDWWVAHYEDDPARTAGWMHHYFCKHCAVKLSFDPAHPHKHKCSKCGKLRQDQEADEAWNAAYRSGAGTHIFDAAVLYKLYQDQTYLNFIRKVLAFYAEHLEAFKVRTPEGYEGKFSGINLSDAVTICWMLNGMELIKEEFSAAELEMYKNRFFFPMAEFLHTKKGGTPNISCWMKSALGMIGLFFNEHKWCSLAANGEEGIKRMLSEGLLPEGFWYESSFHYHFYCAEGLTYYAVFCELYNYDFSKFTDSIRKMYRHPVQYAFPNGRFPSPNDGWPLLSFSKYAHQYEWIRNIYDEAPYRYALSKSYNSDHKGGLARLMFGTDWKDEVPTRPVRQSRYDKDIHYVMLQNEQASVFMKYGFVLRGHSHADVMNFELFVKDEVISSDISNSGYGSELFREWQRKSIAHNTVIVDQKDQPNRPNGKMIDFNEDQNSCWVAADDVYPGIDFTRSLRLCSDKLDDTFRVNSAAADAEEHTFDWLFHCSGGLECSLPMQSSALPGTEDGYQLMKDVQSCELDSDWEISWVLPNKQLKLSMKGCPGTRIYIFKGYEHRSDLMRWGVMVRRSGSQAKFEASYRFTVNNTSEKDENV